VKLFPETFPLTHNSIPPVLASSRSEFLSNPIGERIYQKQLLDSNRQEIVKDSEIFYMAENLAIDNRLAPRESRIETFKIRAPKGIEGIMLNVVAKIFYQYTPIIMDRKEMKIEITSDQTLVSRL
jgi:hypothetical protein